MSYKKRNGRNSRVTVAKRNLELVTGLLRLQLVITVIN